MLLVEYENALFSTALDDSLPQASLKLGNKDLNTKIKTPQQVTAHNI